MYWFVCRMSVEMSTSVLKTTLLSNKCWNQSNFTTYFESHNKILWYLIYHLDVYLIYWASTITGRQRSTLPLILCSICESLLCDVLTAKSMPMVSYWRWILSARSSKSRTMEGFSRDMAELRPERTMAGHVRAMQSQSCKLARHTPPWFPRKQYKAPWRGTDVEHG